MICVLNVVQGPAAGKRIWLKESQCVEVGRSPTSDFPIPSDAHLSRHHLLLDSTGGLFRVRDLGSSNGTFLNDRRISVSELNSGDRLRAGLSTWEVEFLDSTANPHQEDGVTFSGTMLGDPEESESAVAPLAAAVEEFPAEAAGVVAASNAVAPTAHLREGNPALRSIEYSPGCDMEATVKFGNPEDTIRNKIQGGVWGQPIPVQAEERMEPAGLGQRGAPEVPPSHILWERIRTQLRERGSLHLFDWVPEPQSGREGLLEVLERMAQDAPLTVLLNTAQLAPPLALEVEQFRAPEGFTALSQSLAAGRFDPSPKLWALLRACLCQDALICLGCPTEIPLESLRPWAQSLSCPSIFGLHLGDPQSLIHRFLLDQKALAAFEWNRSGSVGVFLG
jgi:hypothetical protein